MSKRSAFTLVELLTVIAVIAILASISFGLLRGVSDRQARTRAQADLSAIAAALDAFRADSRNGTYPITAWITPPAAPTGFSGATTTDQRAQRLYFALAGERSSTGAVLGANRTRPYLDLARMDVNNNRFMDPWGRAYEYGFTQDANATTWRRFGFILFSRGPSGRMEPNGTIPPSGLLDETHVNNADNIYVNR